jgi:hypothetical protein
LRTLLHILPLLVSATVLGCQEEPSFRLRWTIDPALAAGDPSVKPRLGTPVDCSGVGVMDVRIVTRDAFGVVVDARTRPCFSSALTKPEGTVAGPALPPGPYAVEIRGVRRDGVGWDRTLLPLEELEPNPGCVPELEVAASEQRPTCSLESLSCDCTFVEVAEGRTEHLDGFVIDAPPQCQDGVDNDQDGLVDMFDPACRMGQSTGDLYAREDAVVIANAQLVVRASVLDDNPVATCKGLGISRFIVTLDEDSTLAEPICSTVLGRIFQASAMVMPDATHTVRVVAVDFAGQPLTIAKETVIHAPPGGGGRFDIDVDFSADDFLQPIVASAQLIPRFSPYEGIGSFTRGCQPDELWTGGTLTLPEVRLRLLGTHGQPLSPAPKLTNDLSLDGQTSIPCSGTYMTQPLAWGEYLLEVEALSPEGEVCFSNAGDPSLTAPGESFLAVPRVFPIPSSCLDCTADAECVFGSICDEGVCKRTCIIEDDCPDDTRCEAGVCVG